MQGAAETLEIIGRCDNRTFQLRPDLDGDHIGFEAFAESDAGVVALFDDVGETILVGDFQHDLRVAVEKGTKPGRQDKIGGKSRRRDAQIAGRTVARVRGSLQRVGDLVERRCQSFKEAPPLLGRRDAAGGARQEAAHQGSLQGCRPRG